MILTKHAEVRLQQRGIPEIGLELLLHYGCVEHQHGGSELVYFRDREFEKARRHLENVLKEFDRLRNAYAIKVGDENVIITSGHLEGSPRTKTKGRRKKR